MARMSEHYGEHVVGFIDFLGFSQLVQRMDRDPTLIDDIYAILSRLDEEEEGQGFGHLIQMGVADVSVVSDSIFFSLSMDKWSKLGGGREPAWAYLTTLEAIYYLQRYLLKRGIITRGGVAVGSLLHHQNVIFGPALVRAYRLESQLALFPRVIIDPPVLERFAASVAASGREAFMDTLTHRMNSITKRDADGLIFIDYLHAHAMAIERDIGSLFEDIRAEIDQALVSAGSNIHVFQKVCWLANYYNESLTRLTSEDNGADISVLAAAEPIQITPARAF
jgi:hypothetical protein